MNERFSIITDETNVWKNLAFETCLLNYVGERYEETKKSIAILFLWKNDKTIVVGKHQNPYKECDLEFVQKNDIRIARRITGGGAVYHDIGNLNFSFVQSKDIYDKTKNFEIIIKALNNLGINTQLSGRNDILLEGKKFSGNAFYQTKNCALHHGTILIDTDSEIVSKCLTPNKFKLKSKGVDSVKSRIVNLTQCYPNVSAEIIKKEIEKEFKKEFNNFSDCDVSLNQVELDKIYEKYSSKDWIFNDYIDNGIELNRYFDWGEISLKLLIKSGKISNINIITDTLETSLIDELLLKFKDCRYEKECLSEVFDNFDNTLILNDIKNLLLESVV